MKLILHIIDEPEGEEIEQRSICLSEGGGTVGRAADCDVLLADSLHLLSRHHALISRSGENYLIMDTSTNGVFINDSVRALGRGNRLQLQDGDVIQIPGYTMVVSCFNPLVPGRKLYAGTGADMRQWLSIMPLLLLLLLLQSCDTVKNVYHVIVPPDKPKPTTLILNVRAAEGINPNSRNESSPLTLIYYELTKPDHFPGQIFCCCFRMKKNNWGLNWLAASNFLR